MDTIVKFRKSIMLTVKILLVFSTTFSFVETWTNHYMKSLFSLRGNFVVIFSFVLIFATFSSLYGAFKIGIYRIHELIYSFSLAVLFTNIVMYLELSLIARELVPVGPMVIGVLYQILIVAAGSCCANTIYFFLYRPSKMLALFTDDINGFELIKKMSKISDRFRIERGMNVEHASMADVKRQIDKSEGVVVCELDKNMQKEIFSYCYAARKRIYLLPDTMDILINNSYGIQISDTPVLVSKNRGLTTEQSIIKRFFDLLISAVMILVTSPIMIICAVAIKLDDGGPILFKQNRVTKDGRIFNIYKFRSMIPDADKDGAKKAENNDSRITRVGRVIRACRVDELPQFFNVLQGDMSIVGPRPERIENVYEYTEKYPEFNLRHRVKGGLTGYAQLYGKYNTSPADKLNMDLTYIENYSLLQDLKLMVLTVKILFMKESTEGFDASANKNVRPSDATRTEEEKK